MKPVIAILATSAVLLGAGTAATSALPAFSHKRAEVFAVCSGRLAALASHQRSIRSDAAPKSQRLQEDFDMMLDAVMPHAVEQGVPWGQAQRWRSQGWSEIAGFLADVHYSFDDEVSNQAKAATEARIGECRDLLLPTT